MDKSKIQCHFYRLTTLTKLALAMTSAAFAATATGAHANPQIYDQARAAIATGNASVAFNLLRPLENTQAGQVEFDVLYGVAAADAGQLTRAIFALSRATDRAPKNAQAHLELARALWMAGEHASAKISFERAKALGIPDAAQQRFERLLGRTKVTEKPWSAFIDLGLGYDSNANSGIATRSVVIPLFGDFEANLSDAASRKRSGVAQLTVGGDYALPLSSRTQWRNQALLETKVYENAKTYNNSAWQLQSGIVHRFDAATLQLSPYFDEIRIENDPYRRGLGGIVVTRWDLNPQLAFSAQIAAGRNTFARDNSRDNARGQLTFGLLASPSPTSPISWRAELSAASEKVRDGAATSLGYSQFGGRAGIGLHTTRYGEWLASAGFEQRQHRAADILFLRTRRDQQSDLRLTWRLSLATSTYLQFEALMVRNQSNIALNDYSRALLQGSIRHTF